MPILMMNNNKVYHPCFLNTRRMPVSGKVSLPRPGTGGCFPNNSAKKASDSCPGAAEKSLIESVEEFGEVPGNPFLRAGLKIDENYGSVFPRKTHRIPEIVLRKGQISVSESLP